MVWIYDTSDYNLGMKNDFREDIRRRVVGYTLINISPSNIFPILLLPFTKLSGFLWPIDAPKVPSKSVIWLL